MVVTKMDLKMANKIIISYEKIYERTEEIDQWLRANAGQGSARYGGEKGNINHWLNGDDWLYYNLYTMGDLGRDDPDVLESTVFIFRNESIAVEFALRFA